MRIIPLNILTKNITKIYQLFKKYEKSQYTINLFGRVNEEIDLKKPEDYYELIIENGFNIYILVNLFLENKKIITENDDEIKDYINEFEKSDQDEKGLHKLFKIKLIS